MQEEGLGGHQVSLLEAEEGGVEGELKGLLQILVLHQGGGGKLSAHERKTDGQQEVTHLSINLLQGGHLGRHEVGEDFQPEVLLLQKIQTN